MKRMGWFFLTVTLALCLGSELFGFFPIFSQGVPKTLLFSPPRAFLFSFEITLFCLWCGGWSRPQESPLFYWETLPLRLISATSSLIPFSLLWKTELLLLLGAHLPKAVHQYKKTLVPYGIVLIWLWFLAPLLISYLFAEFFYLPNRWFLWSPVLWVPAELGMIPA